MVGSRIRCLNTTSMRKIISKYSRDANQVWPSLKLFSTKTRERSGSAKLGLEEALGLFNSLVLTKPRPPVSKFDKVLEAISSSHQGSFNIRAAVVIALLKVMTSLEIRPSVVTLNMLMECYCCGVGRLDLGFSVLARIFRLGLAPNGATWTRLLTGLVAHGCGNQLRRGIVGRNLIIGVVFDNIKDGVHNNNSVRLKDLVDPRWTNLADRLLSRTCGYTCLLRGFASSGSEDEVNAVFNQLITTYYFPDACSVYTAFHHALCQQGLITVVHALLQLMIFDNKLCLAHKSLDRMIKNGHTPAPPTFQLLIDAFHEESRTDKAHAISSLYLATHAHPPTPPPSLTIVADTDVYCLVLDGMFKAGELSEAIQLFHSLSSTGVESNDRMYNLMVAALYKEEDMLDQVTDLLCEMETKHLKLDDSLFCTLVEGYIANYRKIGKMMHYLFVQSWRYNTSYTPDERIRSNFYSQMECPYVTFLHETFGFEKDRIVRSAYLSY